MGASGRERELARGQEQVCELMARVEKVHRHLDLAYRELRAINRAMGQWPPEDPAPVALRAARAA